MFRACQKFIKVGDSMGKRNTIRKLPEYKGYSAYYYYDEEDELCVGRIYQFPNPKDSGNMVAWYDENEDVMEHLFHSVVDDYIRFKEEMQEKYGKP